MSLQSYSVTHLIVFVQVSAGLLSLCLGVLRRPILRSALPMAASLPCLPLLQEEDDKVNIKVDVDFDTIHCNG